MPGNPTAFKFPALIHFSLQLIPDLFTKQNLEPLGIDYLKIHAWFFDKFVDHCNESNKSRSVVSNK